MCNYILIIKTKNQEHTRFYHAFTFNNLRSAQLKKKEILEKGLNGEEVIYSEIKEGRRFVDEENN